MGHSWYPPELKAEAIARWRRGASIATVSRDMEPDGPHPNTIKGWVKGLRRDGSEPWRLAESTEEEARLIGPVALHLARLTVGGWPTVSEAVWIVRIARLVPRLDPLETYRLALRFAEAERSEDPALLRELEILVLVNPYDPETGARGMYLDWVESGGINGIGFRAGAAGRGKDEDVMGQQQRIARVLGGKVGAE